MRFSIFYILTTIVVYVLAEKHTVTFNNQCGFGTPHLIKGPNVLSKGEPYTSKGPLMSAIAYLQIGKLCDFDGGACTLVEFTLRNPDCPGCGSSSDISLIHPHAFHMNIEFKYIGGSCHGQGARCSSSNCHTAFFEPDDTEVQVACQEEDVDLEITFCAKGYSAWLHQ
ncbi:glycopeptide [Cyathus striatus]|nr:glycopeptide [Cyathus striatus]